MALMKALLHTARQHGDRNEALLDGEVVDPALVPPLAVRTGHRRLFRDCAETPSAVIVRTEGYRRDRAPYPWVDR